MENNEGQELVRPKREDFHIPPDDGNPYDEGECHYDYVGYSDAQDKHADALEAREQETVAKMTEFLFCVEPDKAVLDDHLYLKQWVTETSTGARKLLAHLDTTYGKAE